MSSDTTAEIVHDRKSNPGPGAPVCVGCHREWPCPDANLVEMKPYTLYVCPNAGRAHGTHWTGARNLSVASRSDGYCWGCGALQVPEEPDDGTRWRVSFETDTGFGWHTVMRETDREQDARSQITGLHELAAQGEPVRAISLSRSAIAWEVQP